MTTKGPMHPDETPADHHRVIVNWQKFSLLALALCGMLALVVFGEVEWSDVSAPFGLIIGYGTANGIGAAKGESPEPVFRPRNPTRRAGDLDPDTPVAPVEVAPLDVDQLDQLNAEHRAAERAARRARRAEGG